MNKIITMGAALSRGRLAVIGLVLMAVLGMVPVVGSIFGMAIAVDEDLPVDRPTICSENMQRAFRDMSINGTSVVGGRTVRHGLPPVGWRRINR